MHAAATSKATVPVKVNHGSGAEAVCGYLTNFQIVGKKLKADWHLLRSHPQKEQILEVARVMPAGVGLSASFLPPEKCEPGKARCEELLSVDYVTMPAANPDGLFSARVDDATTARRKASVAKVARVAGAGALGAVGAASIAARGIDRLSGLGILRLTPTPKMRAGLIGAAGALGAAQTVRAIQQRKKRPAYAELREMSATHASREEEQAPRPVAIPPRPTRLKRVGIRAAKVGIGAAGGAYVGRKLGTAAGATTGALAGLLFQSKAGRAATAEGLNFAARLNRIST